MKELELRELADCFEGFYDCEGKERDESIVFTTAYEIFFAQREEIRVAKAQCKKAVRKAKRKADRKLAAAKASVN